MSITVRDDAIIRSMNDMITAMMRVYFNIDTDIENDKNELLEKQKENVRNAVGELVGEINEGRISKAFDRLDEIAADRSMDALLIGLAFHYYLAGQSEEQLEDMGLSTEDIRESIKDLLCDYGLDEWADMFLYG